MPTSKRSPWYALQIMLVVAGCASGSGLSTTTSSAPAVPVSPSATRIPVAAVPPASTLPPVPPVKNAPLNPRVQYPSENQTIASRDSNFILGSIGSGDATLTINGFPVAVAPNGAFIGWLANPPASNAQYELVATRGAETVRRILRVRIPTQTLLDSKNFVDRSSLVSGRGQRVRGNEYIRASIRATAATSVWIDIITRNGSAVETTRVPMVLDVSTVYRMNSQATAPGQTIGDKVDAIDEQGSPDFYKGTTFSAEIEAKRLVSSLGTAPSNAIKVRLVAVSKNDTISIPFTAPEVIDPSRRTIGVLRTTAAFESDTDRVVIGRPIPNGTYKWLLFAGTPVEITGRQGDFTRVRLDANLEVWVQNSDVVALDSDTPMPRRVAGGMRVNPSRDWSDLVIPMANRAPFLVEPDGHTLVVTLYGTQMNPEISQIIGNDTLIKQISWNQVTSDRVRLELRLSQPVYGWLSMWDENRHAMIIRVRRLPTIDKKNPLAGMVIAVDPGHPPAGSTGPTGLFEGDAVLPVGEMVAQLLRAKGAIAVMTRTTKAPVGLTERTVISRRANANAFISIHLNAFGDGVNPFVNNGTSTLFYHQTSEPLARPIQRELMKRLGLRDLGVHYQNLAIARPTWYPSALAEGAFIIMPEQESAMRDPAYQRRFAEGLVAGLESYFRDLAQQ
jgi:N-acetylmuramoyl-L-alanine amidase